MNFEIVDVPPIRNSSYKKKYIKDVEDRLPVNNPYRDPAEVTWVHESVHGINNKLMNKYTSVEGKANGFYLLNGKAVICPEPNLTIKQVADKVPKELRGNIYQLYLVSQQRYWNDRPLYLFDEWSAYIAGSMHRLEEQLDERVDSIRSMLEMAVYCGYLCMLQETNTDLYQAYNVLITKTKMIYDVSRGKSIADSYLEALKETDVYYYIGRHGVWLDKGLDF